MRPGRLDRILYVGPPDLPTRRDIFKIRFSKMAIEPGVDEEELARLVSSDICSSFPANAADRRVLGCRGRFDLPRRCLGSHE
jgi:ATP-dependent 26S proteasome regulatory subunit